MKTYTLNLNGKLVSLDAPLVMGILNATPDSFYAPSRAEEERAAVERARQIVEEGAAIIDVGACSTRPGSDTVDAATEMERLRRVLGPIRRELPGAALSVDTFRADVARMCVEEFGACMVNDVSGGLADERMFPTVAQTGAAYVLMHMRGTPATMQGLTDYEDVVHDVVLELSRGVARLRRLGVCDVVADPGFGFAKTLTQNYELLAGLGAFRELGCPLLVGVSRKRMIAGLLGVEVGDALAGTIAVNTAAMLSGAHIVRVHDVKAAVQAATIVKQIRTSGNA